MAQNPGDIPMSEPVAYFLTWTTYGTWLPGDERGWVEKPGRFRPPNRRLQAAARAAYGGTLHARPPTAPAR